MAKPTNLIVTDEGPYGFSAESPQLPGFVFGRPTATEFNEDLPGALRWAGAETDTEVIVHEQRRGVTAEGHEFVVRVAHDNARAERSILADRILAALGSTERHNLCDKADEEGGEVSVFVCCVPDDLLRFVTDQLDPHGDVLTISAAIDGDRMFTMELGSGGKADEEGWPTLRSEGWDLSTRIRQVIRDDLAATPRRFAVAV